MRWTVFACPAIYTRAGGTPSPRARAAAPSAISATSIRWCSIAVSTAAATVAWSLAASATTAAIAIPESMSAECVPVAPNRANSVYGARAARRLLPWGSGLRSATAVGWRWGL